MSIINRINLMRFLFVLTFIALLYFEVRGQNKFEFSGWVKDSLAQETLVNASLKIQPGNQGIISNSKGEFSVNLNEGNYSVQVSYLGYKTKIVSVVLDKNIQVLIQLVPEYQELGTVDITGNKHDDPIRSTDLGVINLKSKEINKLPSLMGEPDILNALRLSPGIQGVGEGNPGLFVRGGDAGQNLILLDDMVLYNPSHLLGFFPVFSSNIIDETTVYKGGFPAKYGGRISSVIDIKLKEANEQKFSGSGNIGLLSSGLVMETPLIKNKGGIIISARRTYIDLIEKAIGPILKTNKTFYNNAKYNFYDLSLKAKYVLGSKTRLNLMGFTSADNYLLKDTDYKLTNEMIWNNTTFSAAIYHSFNDKFSAKATSGKTMYNFAINAALEQYVFDLTSGIDDWKNNLDFIYTRKKDKLFKYGLSYTQHIFTPNKIDVEVNDLRFDDANKYYSNEWSAYINNEFELTKKFSFSTGLRFTQFNHLGPYTQYYRDNAGKVTDSTIYASNSRVALYNAIDPNLIWVYVLNSNSSIKGSISQTHQFIHLASVGSVSLPTDVWLPSTNFIKPQYVRQVSCGYFRNFDWNMLESSVEVYYKDMQNQIDFLNGILDSFDNTKIEGNIIKGSGRAMGAEFYLKKSIGKTTGWISYTLSKTMRRYKEINNNKWFPAKYDRVHDFSTTLNYKLNDKWDFSAVFIYATGNAMTLPVGRYVIQGNVANHYTDANSFRMPAYHRLDLMANWNIGKNPKFESWLHFSIYNVYNRTNPYFIYFRAEGNLDEYKLSVSPKQMSLFPILPSVSWTFKF